MHMLTVTGNSNMLDETDIIQDPSYVLYKDDSSPKRPNKF